MKQSESMKFRDAYWTRLFSNPNPLKRIYVTTVKQGWEKVRMNRSIMNSELCLNGNVYSTGFGVHCESELLLSGDNEISHIHALGGINDSDYTRKNTADDVIMEVLVGETVLAKSGPLKVSDEPFTVDLDLPAGTKEIRLKATTVSGNIGMSHVSWCDVQLTSSDGSPVEISADCPMDFVPFSFMYGTESSESLLPVWERKITEEDHGSFVREKVCFTNPADGFQCHFSLDRWKEYAVSYWQVSFTNGGTQNSKRLYNVKTLSDRIPANHFICMQGAAEIQPPGKKFGNNFRKREYLQENELIRIDGGNGKSSKEWMPYVEIGNENGGCIFAVGWTGQWIMDLIRKDDMVRAVAGMEDTDTFLYPGESITQPSIMRVDYSGEDPVTGYNILRRFMRREWYPKQPDPMPICINSWGGMPANKHLENIELFSSHGVFPDCYWIDAGWFGHGKEKNADEFSPYWSRNVGCWEVNENVFPNGIREVADRIHQKGGKLMLWFELERAAKDSDMIKEHPDYFFKGGFQSWLNLGNREAADWMLNTLTRVMEAEHVDYYRQDSNADALPYWRGNDEPGRNGISEIRAVEGLYYVLEELKKRFPEIMIDNCASGGRRIDIEMLRRTVILWPTDLHCYPDFDCETMQEVSAGLNCLLPAFNMATQNRPGDTYNFRSNLANGMNLLFFMYEYSITDEKFPWDWLKKMVEDLRRAQPFLCGDFYPLMGQSYDPEKWMIFQFDRPDLQGGLVNVMRRRKSCFDTAQICFRELVPETVYVLEDADCGVIAEMSGADLMEKGLRLTLPEKGSAKLIFYRAK